MGSVARGAEERNKVEEAERRERERERLDEEKRRHREVWRKMWTTPEQRPLAEPPILDWEQFVRWHIPSDLRYNMLFPSDPERRAAMKDLHGEVAVLAEYCIFAGSMSCDPVVDDARRSFYQALYKDLFGDWQELQKESQATFQMATELCRFEFVRLDNDGKTTQLENWIKKGANIFDGIGEEVKQKYEYLVRLHFVEDPLATFEYVWLGVDGGDDIMRKNMEEGNNILMGWPQEVQDKYGYLRAWLPAVTESENESPNFSQHSSSQDGSYQAEYSDEDEGKDEREHEMENEEESNTDRSEDTDNDELSASEPDNFETVVESEPDP